MSDAAERSVVEAIGAINADDQGYGPIIPPTAASWIARAIVAAIRADPAALADLIPPMTTVDEDGKRWRVERCGRWVYSAEEDAVCWESWGHGDDRQVYVLTAIKDAPMKDGATCTGLSAEVDFEDETHYLREWVNGGGVPSDRLREELAKWLVRMSNSPSRAINTLALAMADEERNATIEDGAT